MFCGSSYPGFGSGSMYLVSRDFPGFLRFYFKYGLLEIRCEQARIRWGFVTRQCGTRGVSFRMHAVNPAINSCTRIGRLAVFFAGSGGAPLRRPARPSDGSASSSPFPDHVLTGPCAYRPPVALGTLIREIDRTPASRAKARPVQPIGHLDLFGGRQSVGIPACGATQYCADRYRWL